MISETKRRILSAALGEEWHGYTDDVTRDGQWRMCQCGYAYIRAENHVNRTFADPQDWEDLLEKVVRPNIVAFCEWLPCAVTEWYTTLLWFLTLPIEERCLLVHDFGKEVLGWKETD